MYMNKIKNLNEINEFTIEMVINVVNKIKIQYFPSLQVFSSASNVRINYLYCSQLDENPLTSLSNNNRKFF